MQSSTSLFGLPPNKNTRTRKPSRKALLTAIIERRDLAEAMLETVALGDEERAALGLKISQCNTEIAAVLLGVAMTTKPSVHMPAAKVAL